MSTDESCPLGYNDAYEDLDKSNLKFIYEQFRNTCFLLFISVDYSLCKEIVYKVRKVAEVDTCGNIIQIYDSLSEAARILDLNEPGICNVCNGKSKTTKGHRFVYV